MEELIPANEDTMPQAQDILSVAALRPRNPECEKPPYFRINGVDILPIVKEREHKWQRNDVDSKNSGRTMDAEMHRSRVAIKYRWDITTIPMKTEVINTLLELIEPEFVDVETNVDPRYGYYYHKFYSNNVPATAITIDPNTGIALWDGVTFPLVEK